LVALLSLALLALAEGLPKDSAAPVLSVLSDLAGGCSRGSAVLVLAALVDPALLAATATAEEYPTSVAALVLRALAQAGRSKANLAERSTGALEAGLARAAALEAAAGPAAAVQEAATKIWRATACPRGLWWRRLLELTARLPAMPTVRP